MLQQLSEQVRDCLRRAADAKALADSIADPALKKSYIDLEGNWLFLARSYMFTEGLQDFLTQRRPEMDLAQVDPRLPVVGQLFDFLPLAVYVCDASGIIIYYNGHAARFWGRAPNLSDPTDCFYGSYRTYHLDGGPIERANSLMAEVLRTGDPVQNREIVIERADGSYAFALVNIHPFKDRRGNVLGAINCFQEVIERKRSKEQIAVLAWEGEHPSKNILAILSGPKDTVQARIGALAKVHALFVQSGWAGAELSSIAEQELAPYLRKGELRARIKGPRLLLAPHAAQALALILHELTSNAAKHGSLSAPEGKVEVRWSHASDVRLVLDWVEAGGPFTKKPAREAFGASIIDRMIAGLSGEIKRDWRAQGLACQIVVQL
jgi:two-component sensor histidine kinase/PAS domain-containing protein